MFNTGLGVSEVASLTVGHVRDRKVLEIVGKGKKLREIPLNTFIRKHIEQYLRIKKRKKEGPVDDAPLFVSRKHNRLSVRAIQRALDKWPQEVNIQTKYSPHALVYYMSTMS